MTGFQTSWQFKYLPIEFKPDVSVDKSTGFFALKKSFSINFPTTLPFAMLVSCKLLMGYNNEQ